MAERTGPDVGPELRAERTGARAGYARAALGRFGEDVAARRLVDDGFTVLARNWRCELGEIDIVALKDGVLVVCEVKTRRSTAYGAPQEAVTRVKLGRLRRLAVRWLQEHELRPDQVRVDVVAVTCPRSGGPQVHHLAGVA